jgi:hypothetical protein
MESSLCHCSVPGQWYFMFRLDRIYG